MSTEAPGSTEMFGPYRLDERIGRGGMGEVFRAFDTSRQRTVAVKRLHGGLADDADYQERFRRESRTAARLSSPHVIPIHDFGTIDGRLYIDMRLVSGEDLAAVIEHSGRLEPRRAAEIVRQIADALDAAHDDGLIHRDVKPSNVLITQHRGRDFVYLVDFGIVRAMGGDTKNSLTGTGTAIGTLAYMAPELFVGREMDRRVDVYALACLLFEAVAGRPPFLSEGPALMYDHLNETAPRLSEVAPGSPAALDDVIAKAMAKDPAQRFATAGDFADAALRAVGGEPAPATDSMPQGDTAGTAATERGPGAGAAAGLAGAAGLAAGAAAASGGSGPQGSGPQGATPTYVPGSGPQPPPPSQPWTPAPGTGAGFGQPAGSGPQAGAYGSGPQAGAYGSGPQPGYGQPGYPGTAPQYGTGQYPPTQGGPPPGMTGGQGWYQGAPPPPPKSGSGKVIAIVAAVVVAVLVIVVGAIVILNQGGSSTPTVAPTTPTTAGTTTSAAPTTTTFQPPAGQPAMAQVFPDSSSPNCQNVSPSQTPYRTGSGAVATEVYFCDYASVAPNARVIFARWSSATDACSTYDDTSRLGPRIENFDVWQAGGVQQGPLYTAQSGDTVYSTGIYEGLPFSWEIRTANLDQSNQVFNQLRFRPRSSFGG